MFEAALEPWGNGTVWVLGLAVKGTLLLLIVMLAAAALRRASAGVRHLVWTGGILAVFLLPAVSLLMPWQLQVESVRVPVWVLDTDRSEAERGLLEPAVRETGDLAATRARDAQPSTGVADAAGSTAPWLLLIWGIGSLVLLGRLGFGAFLVRRVLRGATPLDSPDWTHPFIEAADRLSVSRLPLLLASERVPMPVVSGVFRPAIVVPAEARDWTDRRRRAVLCHELAHVRRWDLFANMFGRLACALHWFNPLVWYAARQLRAESERACDDFVLGVGTRASEYADHLLQIVGGARHAVAPAVAIPMAQRREFEGRMLAILDNEVRREPASLSHHTGIAALAFLLILPLSALTPAPAGRSATNSHPHTPENLLEGSGGLAGAMIEGLMASQADERTAAANALGTLREIGAVGPLGYRVSHDADSNVRLTAAWALGQMADAGANEDLVLAALKDVAVSVRAMAVWALGQIADPATLPEIEAALEDSSAQVRIRAAWAIGATRPNAAPRSLLAALHDPNPEVREIAAWAIGRTGDRAAVRALTFAVDDPFGKAGIAALWSLAHIGGSEAYPALRNAMDWEYVDSKLRDALERALAGEAVELQPRQWEIPAIR